MEFDKDSNSEYKISDQTGSYNVYKNFTTLEC
jgi:hypothetical protein